MDTLIHSVFSLLKRCSNNGYSARFLHASFPCAAGQDWRRKQGLPANPNAYGPLTDSPDYTFLDGRRTPAGSGKLKRAIEQHQLAEKIMQLTSEVDFAVERRKQLDQEEEERRQAILNRKLKQKGETHGFSRLPSKIRPTTH